MQHVWDAVCKHLVIGMRCVQGSGHQVVVLEEEGPRGCCLFPLRRSGHHGFYHCHGVGIEQQVMEWRGLIKMGETCVHYLRCLGRGGSWIGRWKADIRVLCPRL